MQTVVLAALAAVAVAVAVALWRRHHPDAANSPTLLRDEQRPDVLAFPGAAAVPEAQTDAPDFSEVFHRQLPVVFRNATFARTWPATRWTTGRLSARWPRIQAHVLPAGVDTVQMLSFVQPLGRLPELSWSRSWEEEPVTAEAFFTTRVQQQSRRLMYLFSPAGAIPSPLRRDLGDIQRLGSPFRPLKEVVVWGGQAGISSPLHYDAAHNAYLQLVGKKRFILFPPNASSVLCPYPRLHPSTRQSCLDFRRMGTPGSSRLRNGSVSAAFHAALETGRLAPIEVVLGSGDVLYLPPYWWHRASTVGDSVSMSVAAYTESSEMALYGELKSHPVPVAKGWTFSQQVAGLKTYACTLASLVLPAAQDTARPPQDDCERWMRALLEQRFTHLDGDGVTIGWTDMVRRARRHFLWRTARIAMPPSVAKQLVAHAKALESKLAGMATRGVGVDPSVWITEKQSLVEDVVASVLGARMVEPFLLHLAGGLPLFGEDDGP